MQISKLANHLVVMIKSTYLSFHNCLTARVVAGFLQDGFGIVQLTAVILDDVGVIFALPESGVERFADGLGVHVFPVIDQHDVRPVERLEDTAECLAEPTLTVRHPGQGRVVRLVLKLAPITEPCRNNTIDMNSRIYFKTRKRV